MLKYSYILLSLNTMDDEATKHTDQGQRHTCVFTDTFKILAKPLMKNIVLFLREIIFFV